MVLKFKEKDNIAVSTTRIISVLCGFNKNTLEEMRLLIDTYLKEGYFLIKIKDEKSFHIIESHLRNLGIKYIIE